MPNEYKIQEYKHELNNSYIKEKIDTYKKYILPNHINHLGAFQLFKTSNT